MLAQRVAQLDALLSHLGLLAQQQNGTNNNTNGNQVWFPREAQILMTIIAYINILIFIIVILLLLFFILYIIGLCCHAHHLQIEATIGKEAIGTLRCIVMFGPCCHVS